MTYTRYAIYHSFAPAPWSDWATRWLGWDMERAEALSPPDGLKVDPHPLTTGPRRYGLHATLKPPFVLSGDEDSLKAAFHRFCATNAPAPVGPVAPVALGRFLALVPDAQPRDLTDLAAQIVRAFDGFRAPPTDAEQARRRSTHLTPEQDTNLTRWGYPHVMDAFRYHITLTDRLDSEARRTATAALDTHLAPLLPRALTLDALSLVGEDTSGRFHLILREPLLG